MTDATKLTGDVPGLLRSLALPLAVGGIGGAATSPNIEPWYDTLDKPPFTPPR